MKRDNGTAMSRYIEAARAHYDLHPQDEEALYRQHLESLGLSGAAKEHMIKERMASTAAHLSGNPATLQSISKLDDKSQIEKLSEIHGREQSGKSSAEPDSNEEVDKYLAERAAGSKGRR